MQEPGGLTTSDICSRLGLLQPRVSSHLALLLKRGAVSVSDRGRQRVYTLSSNKVAAVLEDLGSMFPRKKRLDLLTPGDEKSSKPGLNSEIRQCRTCYDHLAGVAGVELLDEMLKAGWLTLQDQRHGAKPFYRLTRLGSKQLEERYVDLAAAQKSNRLFAYGCLDWTEGRPHLG